MMSKGAQATAVALAYPDGGKGGRGKRGAPNPPATGGFSSSYLRMARPEPAKLKRGSLGELAPRLAMAFVVGLLRRAAQALRTHRRRHSLVGG